MCMPGEIFTLIILKYTAATAARVRKHNQKERAALEAQQMQIVLTGLFSKEGCCYIWKSRMMSALKSLLCIRRHMAGF